MIWRTKNPKRTTKSSSGNNVVSGDCWNRVVIWTTSCEIWSENGISSVPFAWRWMMTREALLQPSQCPFYLPHHQNPINYTLTSRPLHRRLPPLRHLPRSLAWASSSPDSDSFAGSPMMRMMMVSSSSVPTYQTPHRPTVPSPYTPRSVSHCIRHRFLQEGRTINCIILRVLRKQKVFNPHLSSPRLH